MTEKRNVLSGSLGKAMMVLRAFIDGQDAWGVRELAIALGIPGSSVHRSLQMLCREAMLEWDPATRRYRTGIEFYRWAAVLNSRMPISRVAAPVMADLVDQLGESCWLGIYDPMQNRHSYILDFPGQHALRNHATIGRLSPLWETAGGLAVMAFLPKFKQDQILLEASKSAQPELKHSIMGWLTAARAQGYASQIGVHPETPTVFAAPVFDSSDEPMGSLAVAVPSYRYQSAEGSKLGDAAVTHARNLSRLLGSRLLGGAGAGTWHVGAESIVDLIQANVPGLHLQNPGEGGGDAVIRDLQDRRGAYGLAVAGSLVAAWNGQAPFAKRHDDLRAICSLFTLYLHVVAHPGTSIKKFQDLVLFRVSAGEKGYTTARVFASLMQLAGITRNSFKKSGGHLIELGYAEANREFAAGKLDVVISLAGLADPAYEAIARTIGIRLIPLTEHLLTSFLATNRLYEAASIPANTYSSRHAAVRTLASPTVLVTTRERTEAEVFEVTRTLFEKRAELTTAAPVFRAFRPDLLFNGIDIPLHDGARKYWRQVGLL